MSKQKAKRAALVAASITDDITDDHTLALWVWLFTKANGDPKGYIHRIDDNRTVSLERGQVFLCKRSYAKQRRQVTEKMVETRLLWLKNRGSIGVQEVHRAGVIVTVVNYDQYQTFANYVPHKDDKRGTTRNENGGPYHVDNHEKTSRGKPRPDQRFSTAVLELVDSQTEKSAGSLAMLYNKLLDAYSKAEIVAAYDAAKAGAKRFNGHDEAWAWFKTECRAIRTRGVAPVPQYDIVNGERQ